MTSTSMAQVTGQVFLLWEGPGGLALSGPRAASMVLLLLPPTLNG